jgi:hypothetical protein
MMVHWSSYLYKYPSWIDILAYCIDRFTDVTTSGVWWVCISNGLVISGAFDVTDSLQPRVGPIAGPSYPPDKPAVTL